MSRFNQAPAKTANSIDALAIATNLATDTNMQASTPNPAPYSLRHGLRRALTLTLAAGVLATSAFSAAVRAVEKEDSSSSGSSVSAAKLAEVQKETESEGKTSVLGLRLAGEVENAGSDDAAKRFLTSVLPSVTKLLNSKLSETKKIDDSSLKLDPSKLKLTTDSEVRVYFIGEGAGYQNTLGYDTTGGTITTKSAEIIFPNASSPVSTYNPSTSGIKRTSSEPLLPGDFVDLGKFKQGTQLDFFLVADGANKGKNVYSTEVSANPDHINHVVAFALAGSPYLIMGFEDLYGGGDKDFNDVLFAVNIGVKNVMALTGTPEPSTWLVLGTFLGLVYWYQSRRKPVTA